MSKAHLPRFADLVSFEPLVNLCTCEICLKETLLVCVLCQGPICPLCHGLEHVEEDETESDQAKGWE